MPNRVYPNQAPFPRAALTWDGTEFRTIRGHTDGTVHVRGEDQLFSVADVWQEQAADLNAAFGNNTLQTPACGADQYVVATSINAWNETTNIARIHVGVMRGGLAPREIRHALIVAAWQECYAQGWWVLEESDTIYADFIACAAGDDIWLQVHGFSMTRV